jgi:hypothetical protein
MSACLILLLNITVKKAVSLLVSLAHLRLSLCCADDLLMLMMMDLESVSVSPPHHSSQVARVRTKN